MDKLLLLKGGIKTPSCLIPLLVVLVGFIYGIYHIFTCDSVGIGIFQAILIVLGSIVAGVLLMTILSGGSQRTEKNQTQANNTQESLSITAQLINDSQVNNNTRPSSPSPIIKHYNIVDDIGDKIAQHSPFTDIDTLLLKQEKSETARSSIVSKAINYAMAKLSKSEEVTLDNEKYIEELRKRYSLTEGELQRLPNYVEYMKLLQIQDLLQGNVPKRFFNVTSPINFQKSETPIWEFVNAVLYEEKTTRTVVGRTSGFSVRIAKGLYYRTSAFKGHPVIKTELVPKCYVAMVITNKHIYFYSREKSLRFPFTKIVSFVDYEDGIGIQLDKQNAKPILIQNIDGWLAYNIASNIQNL